MVGPSMLDGSSRKVNCRNIAIALIDHIPQVCRPEETVDPGTIQPP